jgi:hypothetical protein
MALSRRGHAAVLVLLFASTVLARPAPAAEPLGTHIVLSWNDLGMHCMNQDHDLLSILPPYNNLYAQVILRGSPGTNPAIVSQGVSLEYSVPGNTTSAGKTNFWDFAQELFGVALPANIGLTGLGLSGAFTAHGDHFRAEGIPITPFPDAQPTVEDPYQQALVVVRDGFGTELARSRPVIPVSVEVNGEGSGCHASEQAILNAHEREGGFNPAATPILCASCHGSPPLTGVSPGSAGYFSKRIHGQHQFIDETIPGLDGCQKCHPGPQTQCLRGTMATDYGMICQDCHGDMEHMKQSIDDGRIPWLEEPACGDCHTAQYAEPAGQLYRESTGHGGVFCAGCHGSPHTIFPSRESRDNQNMVDLQGHAGILEDCAVCHGTTPSGAGPHGVMATTGVGEDRILGNLPRLAVYPSPLRVGRSATITAETKTPAEGKMVVFDARGRTVRLLSTQIEGAEAVRATWDGRDGYGRALPAGVYFVRWQDRSTRAGGKIVLVE